LCVEAPQGEKGKGIPAVISKFTYAVNRRCSWEVKLGGETRNGLRKKEKLERRRVCDDIIGEGSAGDSFYAKRLTNEEDGGGSIPARGLKQHRIEGGEGQAGFPPGIIARSGEGHLRRRDLRGRSERLTKKKFLKRRPIIHKLGKILGGKEKNTKRKGNPANKDGHFIIRDIAGWPVAKMGKKR